MLEGKVDPSHALTRTLTKDRCICDCGCLPGEVVSEWWLADDR